MENMADKHNREPIPVTDDLDPVEAVEFSPDFKVSFVVPLSEEQTRGLERIADKHGATMIGAMQILVDKAIDEQS